MRKLGGRNWELPYRNVTLQLAVPINSKVGRMDYIRVKIGPDGVQPIASSGASILSSTVTADGFVLIPADRDAMEAGEPVDGWLYDAS